MASIELRDVSVSFPIYSAGTRSLKNIVLSATTGGRIGNDEGHVIVQALDRVSLTLSEGEYRVHDLLYLYARELATHTGAADPHGSPLTHTGARDRPDPDRPAVIG